MSVHNKMWPTGKIGDGRLVRFADARLRLGLERLWQRPPAQVQCADPQKISPVNSVAEAVLLAIDRQHEANFK